MKVWKNVKLPKVLAISTIVLAAFIVFSVAPVFAQEPRCENRFCNPLGDLTLVTFLEKVLDALVLIAFPIIVLFLVYAGFLFVFARGDEKKINDAKRIFLWTFVGALLVLGAWTLSRAIKGTVDEITGGLGEAQKFHSSLIS